MGVDDSVRKIATAVAGQWIKRCHDHGIPLAVFCRHLSALDGRIGMIAAFEEAFRRCCAQCPDCGLPEDVCECLEEEEESPK